MGRTQRKRWQRKRLVEESDPGYPTDFLPELFKYMSKMGWKNEDRLSVRNFEITGRGICSKKRRYHPGDALMRLPIKSLISIATIENDENFKKQFDTKKFIKEQRIKFQALLATYLLYQKHLKEQSPVKAYLDSLPEGIGAPYFCAINELQCLPEAILEVTVAQNRGIRDNFLSLKTVFDGEICKCCNRTFFNEIYSMKDFKWAYFIVNSRCVYIKGKTIYDKESFFQPLLSDEPNMALAPFLDLFNHTDNIETSGQLEQNEKNEYEFVLRITEAPNNPRIIKPHRQIFISYGEMTNFKLLTEYGFFLVENIHDFFQFSLSDIENLLKYDKTLRGRYVQSNKFKFIRDHNLNEQMFIHSTDGVSHNLHIVMHLLFKEESSYTNTYNQVAFGSPEQLQNVDHEIRLLMEYKIHEYQLFIANMDRFPTITRSGVMAVDYMNECVRYLEEYLCEN